MSKKCPECGSLNIEYLFEEEDSWCKDCGLHFPSSDAIIASVFDHITESVETLAEKMVYIIVCEEDTNMRGWTSNVVESVFETYAEALAATIEGLKKEATGKDLQRVFKYIGDKAPRN